MWLAGMVLGRAAPESTTKVSDLFANAGDQPTLTRLLYSVGNRTCVESLLLCGSGNLYASACQTNYIGLLQRVL